MLAGGTASGQLGTTGELQGTVVDANARPVAGAEVTLAGSQGERRARSGEDGAYVFRLLPVGSYRLDAKHGGRSCRAQDVDVRMGSRVRLDVVVLEEIESRVEVSSAPSPVDATSTEASTSIEAELFERVPVGRSIADVARLAGGVGTSTGSNGRGPGEENPGIAGASGLENGYIVDGVNVANTGFGAIGSYSIKYGSFGSGVNFDFVDTVEVKTAAFEAEYGQALGGILNVLTRSGGNELHGSVFGYWEPEALRGERREPDLVRGSVTTEAETSWDAGFQIGGPIVKDRFFFFAAYDPQAESVTRRAPDGYPLAEVGDVTTRRTRPAYAGKLTWNASARQKLELSLFGDPGEAGHGPQADAVLLNPDTASYSRLEFGSHSQVLRYEAIPSDWLTVEARIGRSRNTLEESFPQENDQFLLLDYTGEVTQVSGGVGLYDRRAVSDNVQYEVKATGYFRGAGSHEVRLGAIYEDIGYDAEPGITGPAGVRFFDADGVEHTFRTGVLVLKLCGSYGPNGECVDPYYRIGRGSLSDPVLDTTAGYLAVYLQDRWTPVPSLTVSLGVRAESESIHGGGETIVTPSGVIASKGYRFELRDHVAPRAGFSWDFTGQGKGKLYAHAGRFFQKLPNDVAARAFSARYGAAFADYVVQPGMGLGENLDPRYQTFAYGDPILFSSSTTIAPGTKLSYQDEAVIGSEYELHPELSLGARYVHRRLGRVLEDFSEVPAESITAGTAGFGSFVIGNPGKRLNGRCPPDHPDCWVDPKRDYDAFELTLERRLSRRWQALASYRWSHLRGNFEGYYRSDNGQSDPAYTSLFDFPNNTSYSPAELDALCGSADDYAACVASLPTEMRYQGRTRDLPLDRRHQLKAAGSYTLPRGVTLGAVAQAMSGAPKTILDAHPVYLSGGEVPAGGMGRTPWTYQVDFHADYPIKLGKHAWLMLLADVFNVTNHREATGYDTDRELTVGVANPDFGRVVAFQEPRAVRIGVRLGF